MHQTGPGLGLVLHIPKLVFWQVAVGYSVFVYGNSCFFVSLFMRLWSWIQVRVAATFMRAKRSNIVSLCLLLCEILVTSSSVPIHRGNWVNMLLLFEQQLLFRFTCSLEGEIPRVLLLSENLQLMPRCMCHSFLLPSHFLLPSRA